MTAPNIVNVATITGKTAVQSVITVPTGKATEALVGIVKVEADALDRVMRT